MPNFDVVLFRTNWVFERAAERLLLVERSITDRVDLGHGMYIERLPHAVADAIARACNAGGAGSVVPQRYAFVREYAPDQSSTPRDR